MKKILAACLLLLHFTSSAQTGNVGIGTTNPQAQLHTTGTVRHETLKGNVPKPVYVDANGDLSNPGNVYYNVNALAIESGTCKITTSEINVTDQPTAVPSSGIRVRVNISHPDIGNIATFLISPSGAILNLASLNSGENYTGTIFWDGAPKSIMQGVAPFVGYYKPRGVPSDFCGITGTVSSFGAISGGNVIPNGTWKLRIVAFSGYTGTLDNWSIYFGDHAVSSSLVASNYIARGNDLGNLTQGSIYDNGKIGIGTSAPTSSLSVNGTADKVGGGAWGTFSDARVKRNIEPYHSGLKEILQIEPVRFQYNTLSGYTDTTSQFVGVIAQQMEKVLPSTVSKITTDPFIEDKRVFDSSELLFTLINGMKEQQVLIENLRMEITKVKQKQVSQNKRK